jgi:hypothetical protein
VLQNRFVRTGSLPALCLLAGSTHVFHRSGTMSHAFTFRWMGLTRPQQGFTHVRPIGLSLACGSGESEPLDIAAPASHPAVTSDALGVGNRPEHWPEAVRPAHSLDATSCRKSKNPQDLRAALFNSVRISGGCCFQRVVLPSMPVKRKVAMPVGRSAILRSSEGDQCLSDDHTPAEQVSRGYHEACATTI